MARIGYARVSTADQDLTLQVERLKAAGCMIIRSEKQSGKSRTGRDELETILQFLREGDELVVVRLDRLGRSTRDVLNIVHDLDQAGASLRVLDPELTTSGDLGRLVVTVLGMVAEMEHRFILERQRAGIEAAKGRGVYKGRPRTAPNEEIRRRRATGMGVTEIARALKVSRMTVYRALSPGDGAEAPTADPAEQPAVAAPKSGKPKTEVPSAKAKPETAKSRAAGRPATRSMRRPASRSSK
ncbi:recombinase family protein [Aureimonas sp. N4]|uniref:recombinase family protein n=1 Tax=Aureimonas sp. N4 TaxID=1638165 RepID=UPI0007827346|nr:recombinase family protein [Aureimonas sp. N4]